MIVSGRLNPHQNLCLAGGMLVQEQRQLLEANPTDWETALPDNSACRRIVGWHLVGLLAGVHTNRDALHACPFLATELTSHEGPSARSHAR